MVLTSRKNNPQIECRSSRGRTTIRSSRTGRPGSARGRLHQRRAQQVGANWVGSPMYSKVLRAGRARGRAAPMSADFDVQTTQTADARARSPSKPSRRTARSSTSFDRGTVVGPDMKPMNVRLVQTGPGTYEGEFDADQPGNYVAVLNYRGAGRKAGVMLSGMAVNSSPELRDLKSNDAC
jgi:hypothetical protein